MQPTLFLAFPGHESRAALLAEAFAGSRTEPVALHRFPDGEVLVTLPPVAGEQVVLVCGLDQADARLLPLVFAADEAREQGASRVGLVAPYLGYMRQDRRFHDGEAVTSVSFAALLSRHIDFLVTVDPHLHRHASLSEIYTVPAIAVASAPAIARWVAAQVERPLLVGPDEESAQWVEAIAALAGVPCTVLRKVRHGDTEVEVSLPDAGRWQGCQPVLVDDIASSGRTLVAAADGLRRVGLPVPVCVVVHGLFAGNAEAVLRVAGITDLVSCNTVPHDSNGIDVMPEIVAALRALA